MTSALESSSCPACHGVWAAAKSHHSEWGKRNNPIANQVPGNEGSWLAVVVHILWSKNSLQGRFVLPFDGTCGKISANSSSPFRSFTHFKHLQPTMRLIYWLNERNIARPGAALKPYSSQTLRLWKEAAKSLCTENDSRISQSEWQNVLWVWGFAASWVKQIVWHRTRKRHQVNHVGPILLGRKCCYALVQSSTMPPVFKATLR